MLQMWKHHEAFTKQKNWARVLWLLKLSPLQGNTAIVEVAADRGLAK